MAMRTKSRSPKKKRDEQRFPIRVRFRVPEEGFGKQVDQIYSWLRLELGPDDYAWNADSLPGQDATSIYLRDAAVLVRLLADFELDLVNWELSS